MTHHHGHHHGVSPDADRGKLRLALGLILGFMVVEVVAGLLADSLALLSDAAHMLTDAGAVGLALVALSLAARPPTGRFTFGLGRAEILSAQLNGAALLVLAGVIGVEAVGRLSDPPAVEGGIVIVVGLLGAAVNLGSAWALARAERRSLNVEGARAHVMTDLYASLGAALAGAIILTTGFREADPIAALVVSALMLRTAWSLLRESGLVLLEGTPRDLDSDAVGRALARASGRDRGPRPARVGGDLRLPRARGPRARRARGRLPRHPARARACCSRSRFSIAPHDAAGRARARGRAARDRVRAATPSAARTAAPSTRGAHPAPAGPPRRAAGCAAARR